MRMGGWRCCRENMAESSYGSRHPATGAPAGQPTSIAAAVFAGVCVCVGGGGVQAGWGGAAESGPRCLLDRARGIQLLPRQFECRSASTAASWGRLLAAETGRTITCSRVAMRVVLSAELCCVLWCEVPGSCDMLLDACHVL